jgi:hypothetical protein
VETDYYAAAAVGVAVIRVLALMGVASSSVFDGVLGVLVDRDLLLEGVGWGQATGDPHSAD